MNDKSRKENRELLGLAFDAYKTGLSQEQFEAQMAFKGRELESLEARTKDELALKRDALELQRQDKTQFEQIVSAYKAANPGASDIQILGLMRKDGLLGSSNSSDWAGQEAGGEQASDDIAIVGSRPAQ